MSRILGVCLKILLLVAVLGGAAAFVFRDRLVRLAAVNTLFEPDRIVANFSHMNAAFLTVPVPRGDRQAAPLPEGAPYRPDAAVEAWMEDRWVTSLVVMKDGQIVHEDYRRGTAEDDLRISWSVAKSYLSALFGILLEQGAIRSLDDAVTDYAPELAGSAYDGVSIRDVLTMQSGVEFDEDYLDFWSDINRMGRVLALGGSMDGFAAGLDRREAEPGLRWHYVSIDTHVIAMVIRGATGRDLAGLMGDHVIAPLGVETAPYYLADGFGVAFALGGMNVTSRDYARFGQMVLQDGRWQGSQIVPEDWIAVSTAPQAATAPGRRQYGFQWWIPGDTSDGSEVYAHGIYGQYVYINRPARTVIVVTAADRRFREAGREEEDIAMFRRITKALP